MTHGHALARMLAPAALAALLAWAGPARAADLSTVVDHPLVSRFAGSSVVAWVRAEHDEFTLPLGPYEQGRPFAKSEKAEGRVTRFVYQAPEGKSMVEVWRNYTDALAKAGLTTRFECEDKACGGQNAAAAIKQARPTPQGDDLHVHRLLIGTKVRLLTARLDADGATAADVVLLAAQNGNGPVGVYLNIVEPKAMTLGQVAVDAKAIQAGLARDGHIALYGIQFDTDSASLKPASDPTLAQMAEVLKAKPGLKVYIVGHTDNTGTLAHNQALSRQRAESVAAALVARHGIDASRLSAQGVASFAPVASNDAEAGRAKNRRVEMAVQ